MIEFLTFAFANAWHYFGILVYLSVISVGLTSRRRD